MRSRKALKNAVLRVLLGGSCISDSRLLRTTGRGRYVPERRSRVSGFRLIARKK
jgi:formylglycine-generating enzyme required for sulfatase activity